MDEGNTDGHGVYPVDITDRGYHSGITYSHFEEGSHVDATHEKSIDLLHIVSESPTNFTG